MGGRLPEAAKRRLDVLPNWDRRLKVRYGLSAAAWRAWEDREVARLSEDPPTRDARVDVVIPTFRRPDLLRRALDSVLAQSVQDLAVHVVDDGGGVLEVPDDPRVRCVSLSVNTRLLGVVNNVGIRLGRAPAVAILNDDNTWRPTHLERTLEALDRGLEITYAGMRRHDAAGRDVDVLAVPFSRSRMRTDSYTDSSTLVFRRFPGVHFSRVRRSKHAFPKEDWEFVWRYSRGRRVGLSPEVTVDYLIHDGSYLTDWSSFWRDKGGSAS